MGLISKIAKGGIAKKVIAEARKPENQAKAKKAFRDLQAKRAGSGPRR